MPSSKNQKLDTMRHSAAHLLAVAVQKLWPGTKFAIGPAIEEGFYYDFEFSKPIMEEDLPKIEKEMEKIKDEKLQITNYKLQIREAVERTKDQPYKQELIQELEAEGNKEVSFYRLGDFEDLCAGPHVANTGKIGFFKLLSIAGAYWRGSEKNKMLTRIYATAFQTKKGLKRYLEKRKKAIEGNHRKIGKEMELFAIMPKVGQGLPVWLPNGYVIRREIEDYMIRLERIYGYQHILSPIINKKELFETSGHLGFYDDSMYPPMKVENESYYLKPMNCPVAMLVFALKKRSYRELPLKIGEIGTVYRYEQSGELHGLQRVRGFTQNDAHIFCTPEQLENQINEVLDITEKFYKDIGFDTLGDKVVLALSDQNNQKYKYSGNKEDWQVAEQVLRKVLKKRGIKFNEAVGDAVFYGPKIDINAVNVFGKEDAISTIQLDFNLPKRFNLKYVDASGKDARPFVIHRALVGSFERFFAFLIEHYTGKFPVWLSPVQVIVLPVSEKQNGYAQEVFKKLQEKDIRTKLDLRSETLQAKIRDAQIAKIPYMVIVGEKEKKAGRVSLRLRSGEDLGTFSLESFIKRVKGAIETKT